MENSSPKKSVEWYVKWTATILILISVLFRQAGTDYHLIDMAVGSAGTVMWLWVSILWKDRALIILNSVMLTLLLSGVANNL